MAYDYSGSWDQIAGNDANLFASNSESSSTPFNGDQAVQHYKSSGVDPRKIILGMPLYGRAFTNTRGLGQSFYGVGGGSWESGIWDYKALPQPGATEHVLGQEVASFSYDQEKQLLISYDVPDVIKSKADYVKAQRLGGGMWWESSGDKSGNDSLVSTVLTIWLCFVCEIVLTCMNQFVDSLGGPEVLDKSQNGIDYPTSKYTNLRHG